MRTVVYISRHSQAMKDLEYNYFEVEQNKNERLPLGVEGEMRAKKLGEYPGLKEVEILYSSHYVRAMATAKYIAFNNGIKINVDARFGERKFGVKAIEDLPETFFDDQIKNWDYKLPNGESMNETSCRIKEALMDLLDKAEGKTCMIVAHATSLTTMLKDWCTFNLVEEKKATEIYFKGHLVFHGQWNAPELFKLTFEDKELIDIENIEINY